MVVLKTNLFLFIITVLFESTVSWDLTHLGIYEYQVLHVSIFRNRAYLSIKIESKVNNKAGPTLIEAPWPENELLMKTQVFPSRDFHNRNNCKVIQQAISSDIDMYGRLWVLDKGNHIANCSAKLVIFNIFSNHVVKTFYFSDTELQFSSILTDPTFLTSPRAYIGVSNANVLFVCMLYKHKCTEFIINEENNNNLNDCLISTENIAISKSEDLLFMTSPTLLPLFGIQLELLRRDFQKNILQVNAHYQREKLGPSKGLIADSGHGLSYYLPRDFAIVRWDTRKPLTAEGHEVLIQSFQKLPDVSQLILDPQETIWAVINAPKVPGRSINPFTKPFKSVGKNKMNSMSTCIKIMNKYDYSH